jgi:hypothetical protein
MMKKKAKCSDSVDFVYLDSPFNFVRGQFASTMETISVFFHRHPAVVKLFYEIPFHSERGHIDVFSSCAIRRV